MENEKRSAAKAAQRGRILRNLSRMIDLLWLSIIFFVTCIPVVTIGPAVTALYYTVVKVIRRERGKLAESYFSCFKSNFRQGFVLGLVCLVLLAACLADSFLIRAMADQGSAAAPLAVLGLVFLTPLALLFPWLFSYLSRFSDATGTILKNAFLLSVGNFGTTLATLLVLAAGVILGALFPVIIPILPGPICFFMSRPLEKVFRKITSQREIAHGTDDWYNE